MNLLSKINSKRVYLLITLSLITFSIAMPRLEVGELKQVPIYPLPFIEHLSLGYSENLADSMWIRAIQDFNYCEKKAEKKCQAKGWLYQMLVAITKLSPEFKMPMRTGPVMMSVIVGDVEGASDLFSYAVMKFPDDWSIAYYAGYHALYEEKNNAKAAQLMEQAARHGAPAWLYNLATKLYTKAGEREIAIKLYEEVKKSGNFNSEWLKEMRTRMNIEE